MYNWRGLKMKKISLFLVILLVLGIVGISGCTSSGSGLSKEQIKANATTVTANELYDDRGTFVGKSVKMKAEVLQPDDSQMRVCGVQIDSYGINKAYSKDILVTGDFSNVTVYEKDEVYIYGIFKGQSEYTTVLGANRKVPEIESAWVEPTGNKFEY